MPLPWKTVSLYESSAVPSCVSKISRTCIRYKEQKSELIVRRRVRDEHAYFDRRLEAPFLSSLPPLQPSNPHARTPLRTQIKDSKDVVDAVVCFGGAVNCRAGTRKTRHSVSTFPIYDFVTLLTRLHV